MTIDTVSMRLEGLYLKVVKDPDLICLVILILNEAKSYDEYYDLFDPVRYATDKTYRAVYLTHG